MYNHVLFSNYRLDDLGDVPKVRRILAMFVKALSSVELTNSVGRFVIRHIHVVSLTAVVEHSRPSRFKKEIPTRSLFRGGLVVWTLPRRFIH
jgi:hypothetical protein